MTDTMTDTVTPYRSTMPAGRDGFAQLLRGEWTKFRTVRGWVVGTAFAAVLMVLFGFLAGSGSSSRSSADGTDSSERPSILTGPGGEAVTDSFYFVHQPLDGDGSITVRVSSLIDAEWSPDGSGLDAPAPDSDVTAPWTKAGLIIKENTSPGSAYAAIMVTDGHGVRMQHNFTGDTAGPAGAVSASSPRWLRLTRTDDTLTGDASTDGTAWTTVGSITLAGLPATAQAGLFVASPGQQTFDQQPGASSASGFPTVATATFDAVELKGTYPDGTWNGMDVGIDPAEKPGAGRFQAAGDRFTLIGSGDIAPVVGHSPFGVNIERTLVGTFAALTVLVILGVLFISTEYRRGLIRTSLATSPRRGRILAAKAIVIGTVTFVAGLVASVITIATSELVLRANGNTIIPIPWLTEVRIVAGTAALLAVAAVLAVAVGTIVRRSAATVATVIVLTVLPYLLAVAAVLPAAPAQWLLRVSPAAAFAIQQSVVAYPQVDQAYTPAFGFFPLGPWSGFTVLCGWTLLALGLATYLLRRRDA